MFSDKIVKQKIDPETFIKKRIKNEEKFMIADSYDKKMKTIGVNADWFETQQKFEVKKQKKINDGSIHGELTLTNKDIKKHRFFQLKDLYLYEMKQYEQELNKKGMAIIKER
jgi:hypothetical protein